VSLFILKTYDSVGAHVILALTSPEGKAWVRHSSMLTYIPNDRILLSLLGDASSRCRMCGGWDSRTRLLE